MDVFYFECAFCAGVFCDHMKLVFLSLCLAIDTSMDGSPMSQTKITSAMRYTFLSSDRYQ